MPSNRMIASGMCRAAMHKQWHARKAERRHGQRAAVPLLLVACHVRARLQCRGIDSILDIALLYILAAASSWSGMLFDPLLYVSMFQLADLSH
eukprot:91416-Chlamydomonas_euryale.AAC.4